MTELFGFLNTVSPLAVIALLAYVIYLLVKNKRSVHAISTNHLHGLPEMSASLQRIEDALLEANRQHTEMLIALAHLRARVNGREK